jgi:hypothetical protein
LMKGQEARLYMACVAAVVLPVSMFIYAWTASPNIPWIVPLIGLTVCHRLVISYNVQVPDSYSQAFTSGLFLIYQVSFLYLADWYVSRHIYPTNVWCINTVMVLIHPRLKQDRVWLVSPHFLLIRSIWLRKQRKHNGIDVLALHTEDVRWYDI